MLGDSKARQICEATHHEWKEEYYGYKCETCGEFIPYGCEPWMPLDDEEEDYHSYDCTCEDCLQNHPERDILYGDGEYFDWTGLTDDEAAEHSVHPTAFGVGMRRAFANLLALPKKLLARIGGG